MAVADGLCLGLLVGCAVAPLGGGESPSWHEVTPVAVDAERPQPGEVGWGRLLCGGLGVWVDGCHLCVMVTRVGRLINCAPFGVS